MSYWIYLQDADGQSVAVDPHTEGGTYELGGCGEAEINVTYNYRKYFDFRALDGCTGGNTLPFLQAGIARLGTKTDLDYWAPTPGNVGHTLAVLLVWACANQDATWHVS